ncbi:unnamed protein product [Prunus armeniaca]|uniref:phosphopyruvate hydratase n=1 Tax=Prunus armeniaca TaxID=36596 RepID=A0A6J5VQ59_PRUAR|nr:unnamed protein product [Prunus armeniaca]
MVSHRRGEIEDNLTADLSVGLASGQLPRIEEELGNVCYAEIFYRAYKLGVIWIVPFRALGKQASSLQYKNLSVNNQLSSGVRMDGTGKMRLAWHPVQLCNSCVAL